VKGPLWLKKVYTNGNCQGYLHHLFRVAVKEATAGLLKSDHALHVVS